MVTPELFVPETFQSWEAIYGPLRPVVTVIDLQKEAFQYGRLAKIRNELVSNTNTLTAAARAFGVPILWIRQEFEPDLSDIDIGNKSRGIPCFIKGSFGAQWLAGLVIEENEPEIIKKRYSAFFGTDLDEILRRNGINTIVMAGINTQACIQATALDGYQRDLLIILATDCINSFDEEFHNVALRFLTRKITKPGRNIEIKQLFAYVSKTRQIHETFQHPIL